jgi:hypothetical protein
MPPRRHLLTRREREQRQRRSRWRLVLLGGAVVLVAYYGLVLTSMRGQDSSSVSLDDDAVDHPEDRITLEVDAADLDPSSGSFDVRVRPVPHGELEARNGELSRPLQLEVSAPGEQPTSFDFPANQVVDPVGASVGTTTEANAFPFDRPEVKLRFKAWSEQRAVPIDLDMTDGTDGTDGWNLAGEVRSTGDVMNIQLDGRRETLTISFAIFYLAGIVVVALITVAVIGGAVARGRVDFEHVIWLGAMLVAIPAVRNEMPGVPPIGTAVDLFIFFPSMVIVGVALLAGVAVLAVNEATGATVGVEDL